MTRKLSWRQWRRTSRRWPLFDEDEDFDDDFDPDAVEEEIRAAEKAYLAALKLQSLSDNQWQVVHAFRARLTK